LLTRVLINVSVNTTFETNVITIHKKDVGYMDLVQNTSLFGWFSGLTPAQVSLFRRPLVLSLLNTDRGIESGSLKGFCRPTCFCSMDTGVKESGCRMEYRHWGKLNWWKGKGKPPGSITCTRKQQPRFYWSCSSVVMNDVTPLNPLLHERNSMFKSKQHTCTLHNPWGPEKYN